MSEASRKLEDEAPPLYALVIDSGYSTTRIFLCEFADRILYTNSDIADAMSGKKLSYASIDGLNILDQVTPGITTWAYLEDEEALAAQIKDYLQPLMDFATSYLADRSDDWGRMPIYYACSGSCRMLPRTYRLRLIDTIVDLFGDTSFNPFMYKPEYARILSGPEQAAYQWATFSMLYEDLIPGNFEAGAEIVKTGIIALGEDTFDIVYFDNDIDIVGDFYTYRLGTANYYNFFAKSHLFSGVFTSFDRLNAKLLQLGGNDTSVGINQCLPGKSTYNFTSRIEYSRDGDWVPFTSDEDRWQMEVQEKTYIMQNPNDVGVYEICRNNAHELLLLEMNDYWCNFAHNWDCSFSNNYRPPPPTLVGQMYGTEYIYSILDFLGLLPGTTLKEIQDKAIEICAMSEEQLLAYNAGLEVPFAEDSIYIYCWASSWLEAVLIDGYRFPDDYVISVRPVPGGNLEDPGNPTELAIGLAMYEINTLPWTMDPSLMDSDFPDMRGKGHDSDVAAMTIDGDDNTFMPLGGVFLFLVALVAVVVGLQRARSSSRRREANPTDGEMDGLSSSNYSVNTYQN